MEAFGRMCFSFLLTTLRVLITAWIVQYMYGWFVMPLGGPELSLMRLYGLVYLIRFVVIASPSYAKVALDKKLMGSLEIKQENQFLDFMIYCFICFASLGVAWVIHLFL